tara:strand:- start:214 stop:909 length:696 start_codon:yes stop_codon:yes gene_type:complete
MNRLRTVAWLVAVMALVVTESAFAQGNATQNNNQNQSNSTAPSAPTTPGAPTAPGANPTGQAPGAAPVLQDFGTGFVGSGQNQGQFVGSRTSGQQQVIGGNSGFNMLGGGRGGRGGGMGRFTMPGQAGRTNSRKRVRPRHRVAFTFSRTSTVAAQTSLRTRFADLIKRRPEFRGVEVTVAKAGEMRLTGKVPTESAGRLMAALVRMEPGVRKVYNDLTVAVATAAPAPGTR